MDFRRMNMLNVIIILLSNQAVNISFHVLGLLIFCAFLLVSAADLFENILVYYKNHCMTTKYFFF